MGHCNNSSIQSLKMTNTDHLVEKKMKFLGSWLNDEVTKDVMGKILQFIQSRKGSIVKLQLRRDGLRILKNKIILGLVLQHFIPLSDIYIITYNHKVPRMLFVVSKQNHLYQISTFKCENTNDAGEFIVGYRNIRDTVCSIIHKKKDERFGALNSVLKGPRSDLESSNIEAKKKTIQSNTNSSSILNCTNVYDRASELSVNALCSDGEFVPTNVGGIKVILDKSTEINSDNKRACCEEDAFDAILLLDEEKEIDSNSSIVLDHRTEKAKPLQNGHKKDGVVRISVPSYRNGRRKHYNAGSHVVILPTIFEEKF